MVGNFPADEAAGSGQCLWASRLAARDFCGCFQPVSGYQQAIPSPPQRLDVLRVVGRIAQRSPENPNGPIDAVVEIPNGVVGPGFLLDSLPVSHLALALNHQLQ